MPIRRVSAGRSRPRERAATRRESSNCWHETRDGPAVRSERKHPVEDSLEDNPGPRRRVQIQRHGLRRHPCVGRLRPMEAELGSIRIRPRPDQNAGCSGVSQTTSNMRRRGRVLARLRRASLVRRRLRRLHRRHRGRSIRDAGFPGILVQPTADRMRQAGHLYGDDGDLISEQSATTAASSGRASPGTAPCASVLRGLPPPETCSASGESAVSDDTPGPRWHARRSGPALKGLRRSFGAYFAWFAQLPRPRPAPPAAARRSAHRPIATSG